MPVRADEQALRPAVYTECLADHLGGHVYHAECIKRFLDARRRPASKACPSCRQPFEHPVQLFFELTDPTSVADDGLAMVGEPTDGELLRPPGRPEHDHDHDHEDEDDGDGDDLLPDISYYEENMLSLQHSNQLLTAKLADMERTITTYQRRCEAQEEAKSELKRQIAELGSWLERVRHSEADKNVQIQELEERCRISESSIEELEEENAALSAENKHYQTLRSPQVQEQICALRIGSKEEVLSQLQISLEVCCQMREQLERAREELLDSKVEAENLQREINEIKKSARLSAKPRPTRAIPHSDPPQLPQLDIDDQLYHDTVVHEEDVRRARCAALHVPRKFLSTAGSSRRTVPDGAGGSKGVLQVNSGKRFLI